VHMLDIIPQERSNINEQERMIATKANKSLCICPTCPTYNECAKDNDELLYCVLGRSITCLTKESGCICPACKITENLGLTKDYFCINGTETKQRGLK